MSKLRQQQPDAGDEEAGTATLPARSRPEASDVLVSIEMMTLSAMIRRGAALAYRRELGLGYNEWRVISVVGFNGPLPHKELAEQLGLDKGQVSREVTELASRGLLTRTRASRVLQIRLTDSGWAMFDRLTQRARERNLHLLSDLSAKDREHLFAMLRAIRTRAIDILRHEQDPSTD